jgi:hypothetical protein
MRLPLSTIALSCASIASATTTGPDDIQYLDANEMVTNALSKYNAVYNGTLTLNITTIPSSNCARVDTYQNFTIRIGSKDPSDNKNNELSRPAFDSNPFYFKLVADDVSANSTSGLAIESSHDTVRNRTIANSVFWNLTATRNKAGNAYDVTGVDILANRPYNSFWLPTCQALSPGGIEVDQKWSMRGSVAAQTVNLEWTPQAWTVDNVTYQLSWSFAGNRDDRGPTVQTDGELLQTQGTWPFLAHPIENAGTGVAQGRNLVFVYGLVSVLGLFVVL